MAPATQAPTEYLKHPGRFATTETARSEPPMTAPSGVSNGEEAPKSRTKPVFLDVLCQVTVVPTFTQNGALALAPGMLGVTEAASLVRLMSATQGFDVEPHLVPALHKLPGLVSEHTFLSLATPRGSLAVK